MLGSATGRGAAQRLALARLVSSIGSVGSFTGIAYTLWELTGSAVWVSAGIVSLVVVGGLVQPLAGLIADRHDRRRVMIASDLATAAIFGVLALLASSPLAIVIVTAAATVTATPFWPASRAAMPNLVDEADLPWANGRIAAAQALGVLLGPVLAAGLLAASGPWAMFAANAVTFALSALIVSTVRARFQAERGSHPAADGAFAGLHVVRGDRGLRLLVAGEIIAFAGFGTLMTADAPLSDAFGQGSTGYALLIVAWGLGQLIGTTGTGRILPPGSEPLFMVVGLTLLAVGTLMVGVTPTFWIAIAGMAVGGLGIGGADVARQTFVQRRTHDAVAGRVFAALEFASVAAIGLGTAGAGPAIDAIGAQQAYVVVAALMAVGVAVQMGLLRLPEAATVTDVRNT